jgi:hydrogenase/urease accessory protein HupE
MAWMTMANFRCSLAAAVSLTILATAAMRFRAILIALFALCGIFPATAHQVDSVELEFLQTDGKWKLEGLLDIAYMLPESRGVEGAPPLYRKDVMDAPDSVHKRITVEAEATLRKLLALDYNGKTIPWDVRFPDFETQPLELPPEEGGWALMKVEITTSALPGPGKLTASWHDDQQSELIIIVDEGDEIGLFPISSGMSEVLLTLGAGKGATAAATTPTRVAQTENWIISGYQHVIPLGLDHLLFILGLFLLAPRWKPLMGQSLLFTLAHSATLALAIFGIIALPPRLVEILIAASIAWIGIENLLLKELKPSRLYLVFGFGLLHGMGFASVLREKLGDLSGKQLALPLVGFNVGVELAQITVLAAAFLALWPLRKWTAKVQVVGSAFVAMAGLFWMFERIFA